MPLQRVLYFILGPVPGSLAVCLEWLSPKPARPASSFRQRLPVGELACCPLFLLIPGSSAPERRRYLDTAARAVTHLQSDRWALCGRRILRAAAGGMDVDSRPQRVS